MFTEVQKCHFGHSSGFHFLTGSTFLGGIDHVRMVMQVPSVVVLAFSGFGASRKEGYSMSSGISI